jgi:hypothetical protein
LNQKKAIPLDLIQVEQEIGNVPERREIKSRKNVQRCRCVHGEKAAKCHDQGPDRRPQYFPHSQRRRIAKGLAPIPEPRRPRARALDTLMEFLADVAGHRGKIRLARKEVEDRRRNGRRPRKLRHV